eukprot:2394907-Amphidinium_carterae.1
MDRHNIRFASLVTASLANLMVRDAVSLGRAPGDGKRSVAEANVLPKRVPSALTDDLRIFISRSRLKTGQQLHDVTHSAAKELRRSGDHDHIVRVCVHPRDGAALLEVET